VGYVSQPISGTLLHLLYALYDPYRGAVAKIVNKLEQKSTKTNFNLLTATAEAKTYVYVGPELAQVVSTLGQ
jgi:hypothetical protein